MQTFIKLLLAAALFLCLADMPYGYFQLVRFMAFAGFALLAWQAHRENKQQTVIIFGLLAILFQPFLKISLGRSLWNVVDVVVAVGLLLSLVIRPGKRIEE